MIAESVARFFAVPGNREVVEKLRRAGVDLRATEQPLSGRPAGSAVSRQPGLRAPPGGLETMTREEAESAIPGPGRQGHVQRLEEDGLRRCRRDPRIEAGEGRASSAFPIIDEAAFVEILEHGPPEQGAT